MDFQSRYDSFKTAYACVADQLIASTDYLYQRLTREELKAKRADLVADFANLKPEDCIGYSPYDIPFDDIILQNVLAIDSLLEKAA